MFEEIKSNDYFRELKVIMIGLNKKDVIRDSYENGANLYVIQPSVKSDYQNIFKKVFSLKWDKYLPPPSKDKFVLTPSRYRV